MVVVSVSCQLGVVAVVNIVHRFVSASRLCPLSASRSICRRSFMTCSEKTTNSKLFNSRPAPLSDYNCPNKRRRVSNRIMKPAATSSFYGSFTEGDDYHRRVGSQVSRRACYVSEARPNDWVVRVVSYNLLAQHQIDKNSYLYKHCSDEVLEWDQRRDKLFKEIETFACDIMCLQEVQVDHFSEYLEPFFDSLGFESHFKNKTRCGYDGVAIAFRRSRFELMAVEPVEYHRPDHPVLHADNVGIILLLQPRVDSASSASSPACGPLCVANTHLYFNANRGDVKMAQLCLLLAAVERMARVPGSSNGSGGGSGRSHHSVILCGDLNSEPTSPLFRFLTSGRLANFTALAKSAVSDQNKSAFWSAPTEQCLSRSDLPPPGVGLDCRFLDAGEDGGPAGVGRAAAEEEEEERDVLRHVLDLSSVYPLDPNVASRAERRVTSFTAHDVCCVDHIMFTHASLRLLAYCDTVRPADFTDVAGIPNEYHGSDHIPLIVDFALRTDAEGVARERQDQAHPPRL